jgi:hypothetical protein
LVLILFGTLGLNALALIRLACLSPALDFVPPSPISCVCALPILRP